MAQKEIVENGVKKLVIYVNIRCSDYPGGRIQRRKRIEGVEKGSKKANSLEREMMLDFERLKALRETVGSTWEIILGLY